MSILDEIVQHKRVEVEARKKEVLPETHAKILGSRLIETRGFKHALEHSKAKHAVIAEVKRRSPSKGELRSDFDPVAIARQYEAAGCAAISVLTDEKYFGGHLKYLKMIRAAVKVPLLRKDFIIDEYQVAESLVEGADAILLIARILGEKHLIRLYGMAMEIGLDVLVEIHDLEDLKKIGFMDRAVIGINNRNLDTFTVDLNVTRDLVRQMAPGKFVVAESGIQTPADLALLRNYGARGALIGESLMRAERPGDALKVLLS